MDKDFDNRLLLPIFELARTDLSSAIARADALCCPIDNAAQNFVVKANIYMRLRDFASAEHSIKKALSIDNGNLSSNFYAGIIYFKWQKFDRALMFFETVVNLCDESNIDAYREITSLHMSYCLIELGDSERAKNLLINCDPDANIWLHGLTNPRQMLKKLQ